MANGMMFHACRCLAVLFCIVLTAYGVPVATTPRKVSALDQCPQLPEIVNGETTYKSISGAVAAFHTCDDGYALSDSPTQVCLITANASMGGGAFTRMVWEPPQTPACVPCRHEVTIPVLRPVTRTRIMRVAYPTTCPSGPFNIPIPCVKYRNQIVNYTEYKLVLETRIVDEC